MPQTATTASLPSAAIVIPTRDRPTYLEVALASIAPQAQAAGVPMLVVDDAGASQRVRAIAERHGARYEPHPRRLGLNAARNTGVDRSAGELVVFVDDDVEAPPGWLQALLQAAATRPDVMLFAGAILPRLEGRPPRSCGREQPPITSLDLGVEDLESECFAWGANMAVRRRAFDLVGRFDPQISGGGDEQEWQERLLAAGRGPILYVAGARLVHRRAPEDATLRALARAACRKGREVRRYDERRGRAPSAAAELTTLIACLGHCVRRRCPNGLTMAAHSAGRLREALRGQAGRSAHAAPRGTAPAARDGVGADDFLSGESGTVGRRDMLRRELEDRLVDGLQLLSGRRLRLLRAARRSPSRRRVLALCLARPERQALVDGVANELRRSRHELTLAVEPPAEGGKFESLNALVSDRPLDAYDWLLVIDDDMELPHRFLDGFLFLAERFALDLAQPAHRRASHAAWPVTRRRPRSLVRETSFVEIGPVTAFARNTFTTLLPFPTLRMGWGLDAHWAALARQRGWRCGVIDALAINHRAAPVAQSYSREEAIAEARAFLAERPYLPAAETGRTLAVHRRW
jgi:GT2 family glycosyltransferase